MGGSNIADAICFEDEAVFVYYIDLGVVIPKAKIAAVSELCNQFNYPLKFGTFCFDLEHRKLTFRLTQAMNGTKKEQVQLMEHLIKGGAITVHKHYKEFMKCIYS